MRQAEAASLLAGRELLAKGGGDEFRQRGAQAIDHALEHDSLDVPGGGMQQLVREIQRAAHEQRLQRRHVFFREQARRRSAVSGSGGRSGFGKLPVACSSTTSVSIGSSRAGSRLMIRSFISCVAGSESMVAICAESFAPALPAARLGIDDLRDALPAPESGGTAAARLTMQIAVGGIGIRRVRDHDRRRGRRRRVVRRTCAPVRHETAVGKCPEQLVESLEFAARVELHAHAVPLQPGLFDEAAGKAQARLGVAARPARRSRRCGALTVSGTVQQPFDEQRHRPSGAALVGCR